MIVKNEENMLKKTLPVLVGNVDEVIVVDTGSSDNTAGTAKDLGAKVFDFPWRNDFAAARNEAISRASSDWVIWIDADETMKKEDIEKLKTALKDSKENGFVIPLFECKEGEYQSNIFYYRLKVFRNNLGYRFIRPINEELVDKDEKFIKGKLLHDVHIYHWGGAAALSPEKLKQKKERNLAMLKEAIGKNPGDAYFHYLMANNLRDIGLKKEAAEEYRTAADLLKEGVLASNALTKRAWLLFALGENEEGYASAKKAVTLDPRNAEAYNAIGAIYMAVNNYDKAIEVLSYSSKLPVPEAIEVTIDINQYTYLPHYFLGNAYLLKGDRQNALASFEKAYSLNPSEDIKKKIEALRATKNPPA